MDHNEGDAASSDVVAEPQAFGARFPPEAFEQVAQVVGPPYGPEMLAGLRNSLLPDFYSFFINCPGQSPAREETTKKWEDLKDAATDLLKSLRTTGASGQGRWTVTARDLLDGRGTEKREDRLQFYATLQALVVEADEKIQRLRASRGRAGRPSKAGFRDLGRDLIRFYERFTVGGRLRDRDWGRFCDFAIAASRCAQVHLPELNGEFPNSRRAIRDSLRHVWNLEVLGKTKNTSDPASDLSA